MAAKQARNKIGNFNLVTSFIGYRAKADSTKEERGVLIYPSQNVLISSTGRVSTVAGYSLDGVASAADDSGILSSCDFLNFKSDTRNMRAGFLTTALNDGKLQYRYITGTNTINWVTLKSGLTNVRLSYAPEYWDNVALVKNVLWVDGTNNIFSWNGAVTTVASATATTVTKQGTNTWAQEGFSATGSIVINGVSATYTGGNATTTLTGVSVDFSATAVGSIVHQEVVTTTLASMTGVLATFAPTVIGVGRSNQVYLGSSTSSALYISRVNSYINYTFTSPVRLVGEGNLIPLDAPPRVFIPQEMNSDQNAFDIIIGEGANRWAIIRSTLSADLTAERLEHIRIKTAPLQGVKSERFACKMKNRIAFLGNDNVLNLMGGISEKEVPGMTDFSYPIVNDMNGYDFTDGSIAYYRNFIFVAIPKQGIVRIYNMTNQTQQVNSLFRTSDEVDNQPWFWESPIKYPITGFYIVDGILYGHSAVRSESYKLFDGGSFNGQDIDANATFSYDDLGDRTQSKASDSLWSEGYIKQNTIVTATVYGDLDAFENAQTTTIDGSNTRAVAFGSGGHSLGKNPFGKAPLGGAITVTTTRAAWFRTIKTYPQSPCYLETVSFNSKGVDQGWELLSFGTNAAMTNEGNTEITE